MKLPRVFVATLLTGCSAPSNQDAGTDGGKTEPCTKGEMCDAGSGFPPGQCIELTESDGGMSLSCQPLI